MIKTPQYPQYDTKRSPALSSPTLCGNASSEIKGVYASSTQVASEPPLSIIPKIPREQLQAERKAEKEAEVAARSFLGLLGNCVGDLCAPDHLQKVQNPIRNGWVYGSTLDEVIEHASKTPGRRVQ